MTPAELAADGSVRYLGLFTGRVLDVADPEGLHRVRVEVPGLIERSAWALPVAMGAGGPQRGGWVVPKVGADVIVAFLLGDAERPLYLGGWWGKPTADGNEMPQPVRDAGAEGHLVQALELERVLVTVDERPTKQQLSIEDKLSGDVIQMDLETMAIRIKATSALILEADGIVSISGTQVTIQGRPVLPDGSPL